MCDAKHVSSLFCLDERSTKDRAGMGDIGIRPRRLRGPCVRSDLAIRPLKPPVAHVDAVLVHRFQAPSPLVVHGISDTAVNPSTGGGRRLRRRERWIESLAAIAFLL